MVFPPLRESLGQRKQSRLSKSAHFFRGTQENGTGELAASLRCHKTVSRRADRAGQSLKTCRVMAKSKQPPRPRPKTLDELLDKVSNAREELIAIYEPISTTSEPRVWIGKSQRERNGALLRVHLGVRSKRALRRQIRRAQTRVQILGV